jgi:hypothetical protein
MKATKRVSDGRMPSWTESLGEVVEDDGEHGQSAAMRAGGEKMRHGAEGCGSQAPAGRRQSGGRLECDCCCWKPI